MLDENLAAPNYVGYREFTSFVNCLHFNQYVSFQTRDGNLLDLLLCKTPNTIIRNTNVSPCTSDHDVVCAELFVSEAFHPRHNKGKVYLFNKGNCAALQ